MKEATLLKIQAGKYVDLTELIYRASLDNREGFEMVMGRDRASGDQSVSVIPRNARTKFLNFHEWLQAFLTFAQAYLRSFPQRAGGVIAYIDRINMYSSRYPLKAWTAYDKMFRQQLATNHDNLRWGVEDKPLFDLCLGGQRLQPTAADLATPAASLSATCFRCGVVGHYASFCPHAPPTTAPAPRSTTSAPSYATQPFRAPQRWPAPQQPQPPPFRRPRPSSFSFDSNVCRQFRDSGVCSRPRCAYAHTCTTCGGRHHATSCTFQPHS